MDTQLPITISVRDEGDECFEMVEYIAASQRESLALTIEETLRKWFIINETSPSSSSSVTIDLNGVCFELSYLRFGEEKVLSKCDFPCQTFCYRQTSNINPPKYKEQLHRWTGFDEIILLQPSPPQSFIQAELTRCLLKVGRLAFRRAGLVHIPLLVPSGPPSKNSFEGILTPPFISQENFLSQECDPYGETDSLTSPFSNLTLTPEAHIFISERKISTPNSLIDIKKTIDCFKDIVRNQFKDYSLSGDLFYISAEYHYSLSNLPDQKWSNTKLSYSRKMSPCSRKRSSSGYSVFRGLGLTSSLDGFIQGYSSTGHSRSNELPKTEIAWGPSCDPLRSLELSLQFPQTLVSPELEHDPNAATRFYLDANFSAHSSEWALLSELFQSSFSSCSEEDGNFVFPLEVEEMAYHNNPLFDGIQPNSRSNWEQEVDADIISMITSALFPSIELPRDTTSTSASLSINFLNPSAAPYQSFIWQLVVFCLSAASTGNRPSFRFLLRSLWTEIIRRIRWHWESCIPIPNVNHPDYKGEAEVDLRFGLLHQKLSMLNYCIDRQIRTSASLPNSKNQPIHTFKPGTGSSKFDISRNQVNSIESHRFSHSSSGFDFQPTSGEPDSIGSSTKPLPCASHNELQGSPELVSPPSSFPADGFVRPPDILSSPDIRYPHTFLEQTSCLLRGQDNSLAGESFVQLICPSSIDSYTSIPEVPDSTFPDAGEGRLEILENYRLLNHDIPLYIPITQNPGVMTEDMLRDQAQLFERLGNSSQATKRRAQLQGAQLLSDMEAFKAANPRSSLADFVRWYSPRDWISSDLNGHLSTRMENPDNIWQELWLKAEPIPAHRQKPLFDSTTEGEKALHFLENLSTNELYNLILPTMFLVAHNILSYALPTNEHHTANTSLDVLGRRISMYCWSTFDNDIDELAPLLELLRDTELLFGRAISLLKKFPSHVSLVDKLTFSSGTYVTNKDEREAIIRLFSTKSSRYAPPLARYEPALSTPLPSFLSPHRQEFVCETHHFNHDNASFSNDNWYRVYFDVSDSTIRTSVLAFSESSKKVDINAEP